MHTTVNALEARPGSELLQRLAKLIGTTQVLVVRTLDRLAVLNASQYPAVPGSHACFKGLSGAVATASRAAYELAEATANNPLDATPTDGPPVDEAAMRRAQHSEAGPLLAERLSTAAHHLDLSATLCHYAAFGIARDLKNHPEHISLPQVSAAQYKMLEKIAPGGTRRYTSIRGSETIIAGDGTRLHPTPFNALRKHRLIRPSHVSALGDRNIEITAAGQLVLDLQTPARDLTAPLGKTPIPRVASRRLR
ncbi:hypothetical protein [Streptomyces buecherae]|uniref:hypothetical protein n=1 Tax=Streptomyces buecherae TaxID=2763006 RepID=UPI00365D0F13